jgi:hypothetical protein
MLIYYSGGSCVKETRDLHLEGILIAGISWGTGNNV